MKFRRIIAVAILLGTVFGPGWLVSAQTNLSPSTATDVGARIVSPEQVQRELYPNTATDLELLRAGRAEYPSLSPEIRRKLFEFKRQRDRYLLEQERLIKQLKGATEAEREKIRDGLREHHQQWLERSRSFRDGARERYRELLRELPGHREALEAARESAREDVQELRKRPGVD